MTEQLFLVSIGPVQEFIAAARRSRDLWFGSWLLSELAKTAALTIAEPPWNGRLIFPAPGSDLATLRTDARSVPNRILATIDETVQAGDLGVAVVQAIQQRLINLGKTAMQPINWPEDRPYLRALAFAQLTDLLSGLLFWVSTPLAPDYATARVRLEDLMAGRKLTRTFAPSPIAVIRDPAHFDALLCLPKSTLDGTRESVIDERLFAERGDGSKKRQDKAQHLYERYGTRPAERMSGVDLLKRRGQPQATDADIPSTSHFAALPLLQRVTAGRDAEVFAQGIARLSQYGIRPEQLAARYRDDSLIGGYDAGILFMERLVEEVDRADLAEARGALADLLAATTDGVAPEPYYVLLAADGDYMGKSIERFAKADAHRIFSQALSDFATDVHRIVEQDHQGALVFAGGDDILAFLPLHTALDCAWKLADTFSTAMGTVINAMPEDYFIPQPNDAVPSPPLSLSVGLVIAHHIEPLSDTLQLARDAETFAKGLPGKNALAITLSKRGGADRSIRGRWGNADSEGGEFFLWFQKLIRLHQEEAIPDGVAYELSDLVERWGQSSDNLHSVLGPAIRANTVGIFERKRGQRGEKKVAPEVLDDLLVALGLAPGSPKSIDVATLANELIIAREFAKALGTKAQSAPATPALEGGN